MTAAFPTLCLRLIASLAVATSALAVDETLPARVEFNEHVRPILSDKCFHCHGPDEKNQKSDLRLDQRESALADRDGFRAIVPGNPGRSEAIIRCLSSDPDEQMPPPDSKLKISPREIAVLKAWIEQGATYQQHWAFAPLARPPAPEPGNPIDAFVVAKLRQEGFTPSAPADRATLLRRVTLDLIGKPPTPAETEDFLADHSRDAFSRVVDRLLASPHYGERMALPWLDAARYADTNGYQADLERTMWPWRDWVISAFNRNVPFDQFTIEQLAGDLLPGATRDQIVATGFNRNHRINGEAGIIPEEYLVEYVVDRVETTAAVWLGLTAGCARCHDHKFDPLKQSEFYQLFAFFHNVPEHGKDGRRGQPVPVIGVPTAAQEQELARLTAEIASAEKALAVHEAGTAERLAVWAAGDIDAAASMREALERQLTGRFLAEQARPDANLAGKDGSPKAKVRGGKWEAFELAPGEALRFDGRTWLNLGGLGKADRDDAFSFSVWVMPERRGRMPLLEREDELANDRGFHLVLDAEGRVEFQLAYNAENNAITVSTKLPLTERMWHQVTVTYDGSGQASGVAISVNGEPVELRTMQDSLTDSLRDSQATLTVGGGELRQTFVGVLRDLRIYARTLTRLEVAALAGRETLARFLQIPAGERTAEASAALREYFLEHHDEARRTLAGKLALLREALGAVDAKVVKTMVMREVPRMRETRILTRGEYDKPGARVEAAVPAWLGALPAGAPANRLGLAQWLVSPTNPLTARVAVNRFWQQFFGVGLVKTSEDFGSQSEPPSHPELLDWLAATFQLPRADGGLAWDMKALVKLIVTSGAYQQSSRLTPVLRERDPENRLLARGPRFRLTGQAIRDQALAVAGLLVEKIGGPSVKPYQPAGLWEEVSFQRKEVPTDFYKADKGEGLYRRSLYTFWKRTVNPPTMSIFDASGREVCSVKQRVTNTPLQALALLNEVTFVEAARALAQRMLLEAEADPVARLRHGWRLAMARPPTERELATLLVSLEKHHAKFTANPVAADALLAVGDSPVKDGLDRAELAAYAAVANTLLNLDEVVTKE